LKTRFKSETAGSGHVVSPAVDIGRPRLSVPPFEQFVVLLSPMSALQRDVALMFKKKEAAN
jgi:hypothetical protein